MTEPTRVCVLVDEPRLAPMQARALTRMVEETPAEITLVVERAGRDRRSLAETLRRAADLREWAMVAPVAATFARLSARPSLGERCIPLDVVAATADADTISCTPDVVDGWKYVFPERVVDEMAASADVAVLMGFGFLTGRILDASTHGVLGIHHGDVREYRGQPMGFWEFVNGEPTAGVTLQRLTETLDGGEVVYRKRVDIRGAHRWGEVKAALYDASEDLLAEGIRRLRDDDFTPERPDTLGTMYSHPTGAAVGRYLVRTAAGALASGVSGHSVGDTTLTRNE